ncbi:methyltransferase-like 26 [Schistocerca nitens]|uniref:methyltransferase-like 26 n=1 Tax=Schistocerca nitens TaxID=7011 RepID=UPI002117B664|nr:methyltransferase-like 26 [Schistocerca nitens]XP_049805580.1 methyltransferase-like 26 [Schistocerca nitens]
MDRMSCVGYKLHSPAAERNKEPILEVLMQYIFNNKAKEEALTVLEIASGTGQHIVYFAHYFPDVQFQPSEFEESYIRSIGAYISESGVRNVRDPIVIDIRTPYSFWAFGAFTENSVSFVININMIHTTESECTEHLFKNVQKILKPCGLLFLYGPFAFNGVITPESNVSFNQRLRQENPAWGLRDVEDLNVLGFKYGLALIAAHDMPANNHMLVWKKK